MGQAELYNSSEIVFLEKPKHHSFKDIEGLIFGELRVIGLSEKRRGKYYWWCECMKDGNIVKVQTSNLVSGVTMSCGCLQKMRTAAAKTTHGMSGHTLYQTWKEMKKRCYSKNAPRYKDWGGRGVSVTDEWRDNFPFFYEWCIENGWEEGLQIDRINNDGHYEPNNCRFVTAAENSYNKRSYLGSTSEYKGVHWDKAKNKWAASIRHNRKLHHIGYFDCEKQAASTYNKAAIKFFGEYANLNDVGGEYE